MQITCWQSEKIVLRLRIQRSKNVDETSTFHAWWQREMGIGRCRGAGTSYHKEMENYLGVTPIRSGWHRYRRMSCSDRRCSLNKGGTALILRPFYRNIEGTFLFYRKLLVSYKIKKLCPFRTMLTTSPSVCCLTV